MKETLDLVAIKKALTESLTQLYKRQEALPNTLHVELAKLKNLLAEQDL